LPALLVKIYIFLEYWITRQGIQPIRNKVEAILNIKAPQTRKEERSTPVYWYSHFYCYVTFRTSELLAPLTSLKSRKVEFDWHSSHQQAFDKIKKVIGTEIKALLSYADFN
jgi:hypothetical protein